MTQTTKFLNEYDRLMVEPRRIFDAKMAAIAAHYEVKKTAIIVEYNNAVVLARDKAAKENHDN